MNKQLRYFILIFILAFEITANAQLSVDVGLDTTFCAGLWLHQPDTSFLGSNVMVSGGKEPYNYFWSCNIQLSPTLIFNASDLLNDTTTANPFFITNYFNDEWITLKLKVIDSIDSSVYDSINVRFSNFRYHLNYFQEEIKEGDSIQFLGVPLILGGIEPLSYYWYPADFLSDSTDLAAYASPDSTMEYSLYAIDVAGCKSDTVPFYNIIVDNTSGIETYDQDNEKFKVLNGQNEVKINCLDYSLINKKKHITVYTICGKKLLSASFLNNEYFISKAKFNEKIVIVIIRVGNKAVLNSKVLL
jgi:hypothetical protein